MQECKTRGTCQSEWILKLPVFSSIPQALVVSNSYLLVILSIIFIFNDCSDERCEFQSYESERKEKKVKSPGSRRQTQRKEPEA